MKQKRTIKQVVWLLVAGFLFLNIVAFFHAYKFTHFTSAPVAKTKDAASLSVAGKLNALLFGVNNPRPFSTRVPAQPFEIIKLQSNKRIEAWHIKTANPKGTVVLFHGYSGHKASLLDKSDEFLKLGYNTLLVDFMGSGGSEGNQTTIGFKEAEQVKTAFDYVTMQGEENIYLFGTSLGAVALMKSIYDYGLKPAGIIIECPFGSMYETTCARFRTMQVPCFPMAGLLLFWGGVQNGFWAFGHNPTKYASQIYCPTLLLYGEQDDKVSRQEIEAIYNNLPGIKELRTYPLAGHENYLNTYHEEWTRDVHNFLQYSGSRKM